MTILADRMVFRSAFFTPMQPIEISAGRPEDLPELLGLIKELAAFERKPDAVTNTLEKMQADAFGPKPIFGFYMTRLGGELAGMAVWYYRYSTWQGRNLYLEDIYIKPEFRGKDIGGILLRTILEKAKLENCTKVNLQVLNWNHQAIAFYEKYGAEKDDEWINCILEPR